MEGQLSLLDLMPGPALRVPVEPDGHVLQGRPEDVLRLDLTGWMYAQIELHPGSRGWMWGVQFHGPEGGGGYRVGEKWGKFAPSRREALAEAVAEMLAECARHDDRHGRTAQVAKIRRWAGALR